jgi:hypothetical protein
MTAIGFSYGEKAKDVFVIIQIPETTVTERLVVKAGLGRS